MNDEPVYNKPAFFLHLSVKSLQIINQHPHLFISIDISTAIALLLH